MIREYFQVPNHALEQPKLNILTRLKVLKSSTKFGEFKNFGREARNFDGARRIFYQVQTHFLTFSSKFESKKILKIHQKKLQNQFFRHAHARISLKMLQLVHF